MSWINLLYKVKTEEGPNPATAVTARLHVNYWKLPNASGGSFGGLKLWKKRNYARNLDIGIFLQDVNDSLEELIVCLPFKFGKERVQDLSNHLTDETFLSFLLSHRYRVQSLTDCPTYKYANAIGEESETYNFCLYELCKKSIETESLTQGTMLHIKFLSHPKNLNEIREKATPDSADENNYNIYIRFRIEGLQDNDFCYNEDISNDFLQSAFSKTEMAEVKFNEKRTIDHSDYQTITKSHSFLNLATVNFFFTGSSEDENVTGAKSFDDCELLDEVLWKNYIGGMNPMKKKCISYHWKISGAQKIFFKTVYSSRDKVKMLKYALVVIFLSFIASALLEGVKCVGGMAFNHSCNADTITVLKINAAQSTKSDSIIATKDSLRSK